ncbi:metal ABC transporter ATP-binding protein [Helicobacter sp. MIT 14-3879]|uniref:metal ABC transporter ATP-binding protein n=1 Tax=Helicobacter sp. MIT 14-3879 TaxID=2040649 RepID=UPI000E1EFC30|nr:ABC transporter ATP-binding protein [Helicobacter sp. MIT 14-3879]RDU64200.1 ABC transporter [Helicobacter sp. MIT 14-3879]
MSEIIICKDINFKYNVNFVLKNINFSISQGDFIAFIGPNGGGKSTLAKILLGLLKPTSGSIIYPNVTLFSKNSLIGYTPQDTGINKDFPIQAFDVVLMGFLQKSRFGYKITKNDRLEALDIMQKLEIENLKYRAIGSLSGGQRQRVMIARALCGKPKLLIFDEPTSNIDMLTQKEIYKLLKQININHTIILISHDISNLSEYVNKVLFINNEIVDFDSFKNKLGIYGRFYEEINRKNKG